VSVKTCRVCGKAKPLEAFGKRKDSADGLEYDCKRCKADAQAERHRQTSPEAKAEAQRAYRAGIREDACAVCGDAIKARRGICARCQGAVDVLGGLAGLKQAVRAVRYLEGE